MFHRPPVAPLQEAVVFFVWKGARAIALKLDLYARSRYVPFMFFAMLEHVISRCHNCL
jgi:hypothetical protein